MTTNQIIDEWYGSVKDQTKNKTYAWVDDEDVKQLKRKLGREE